MILLIAGLALLAGCDGNSGQEAAAPAGGFEGPYCVTAREWAAHELSGEGPDVYARGGIPALKKYTAEYLAYLKDSRRQAPAPIHEAAAIHERAVRTQFASVLEKYSYDPRRIDAEASPAEKVALQGPTNAKQVKAQGATRAYDDRVCRYGGEPPAAYVRFKANTAAKPYCKAAAAQEEGFEKVVSSLFDPQAFRSYVTSDSFLKALDAQEATAPSAIVADVKAENEWVRNRHLKVLEKFEYDQRRLLLEGGAEELAVVTYWDPAIREQASRVTAYQKQVCGG